MAETQLQPAAEFQALPLEFIVATPLVAAVKAQSAAAEATKGFILALMDSNKKPLTVEFDVEASETVVPPGGGTPVSTPRHVNIKAPLLSIVPVPHLRIDSLTTHFKYEITQTVKATQAKDFSVELSAQSGAALSAFVSATLKGSVSSKSSEESLMNRSGVLEITVHASEAPMPEGLAKILGLLANSVQVIPAP